MSNSDFSKIRHPSEITRFPYTTLFRSRDARRPHPAEHLFAILGEGCIVHGHRLHPIRCVIHGPSGGGAADQVVADVRSGEHTSELQSLTPLVFRLPLENKNHTHTSVQP